MTRPTESIDLADLDSLRRLTPEWNALLLQLPGGSYFQTADWALAWCETFSRGHAGAVHVGRGSNGGLEGLVALVGVRERLHRRVPPGGAGHGEPRERARVG
jgi:CelD/BcsL family acetyltransferase involved in cellulose biosynthesis